MIYFINLKINHFIVMFRCLPRMTMRHYSNFTARHIGPNRQQQLYMLKKLGCNSSNQLIDKCIPKNLRQPLPTIPTKSEPEIKDLAARLAAQNNTEKTFIGTGYYQSFTPAVLKRNFLQNPSWYSGYTPYQAEISQGTLELLYSFQQMITSLTGLPLANAGLLDEASAAAEAMIMCFNYYKKQRKIFIVDQHCHPQTINVLKTFARPLDINIKIRSLSNITTNDKVAGIIVQYPSTTGKLRGINWYQKLVGDHSLIFIADPLALTLIKSPFELGADIAVGSTQRFGVPMWGGGPHSAYMAAKRKFTRLMPGKIVGIAKDSLGNDCYRLSLQSREQHIRRSAATSNICTSQVLLANLSALYAMYHGPEGLQKIAKDIHRKAVILFANLSYAGFKVKSGFFDTLHIKNVTNILHPEKYRQEGNDIILSIDQCTTNTDLCDILADFGVAAIQLDIPRLGLVGWEIPQDISRDTPILTFEKFNAFHTEVKMTRYLKHLEAKNMSLAQAMIPLGSCTMKLNSAVSLECLEEPGFANVHPYSTGLRGYETILIELRQYLLHICGLDDVNFQPNAGSQGEYAGLCMIAKYLSKSRKICLIPDSAHGTNPATATKAGLKVITVKTADGQISVDHLQELCTKHRDQIAVIMITYPSTFGFFEKNIEKICRMIHDVGGQVYLDGANMNAQTGLCNLSEHVDIMHFNLHKTFAIPHGGGGPGSGVIAFKKHLIPFQPCNPLQPEPNSIGPIAGAEWGSLGILPISWAYIKMMGSGGLTLATTTAILNANYMAFKLSKYYPIIHKNSAGFVSHEFIIDLSIFSDQWIQPVNIVKRLQDYGYHAPTVSWPIQSGLMIEPTESEGIDELDRYCDALINIYHEVEKIRNGEWSKENNPIVNAPHPLSLVTSDVWNYPYSRHTAAYPLKYLERYKFWPAVGRVNEAQTDLDLYALMKAEE